MKTKIYEFIFAHWWRRSRRSNGKVDEKEQPGFLALTSDAFFSFSFLSTPFSVLFRKHKSLKSHSFDYFSCGSSLDSIRLDYINNSILSYTFLYLLHHRLDKKLETVFSKSKREENY